MGFEVAIRDAPAPRLVMFFHPIPKGPKERVHVEVREDDLSGVLRFEEAKIDLSNSAKRRALCRDVMAAVGVQFTDQQVLQWLENYRDFLAEPEGAAPGLFRIIVRRLDAPPASGHAIDHAQPLAAFRAALDLAVTESNMVMEWSDTCLAELAVLDIDYHHLTVRLEDEYLTAVAESIRPKPVCWWISHGGGLHAVYAALKPYTAHELAACAAFAIRRIDPTCTTEILPRTRHPHSSKV